MSNKTYRKIVDSGTVRLACPIDMMTYSRDGDHVIVEAMGAEVFEQIEPTVEGPAETHKPKDLEAARQELAKAIEAAKVAFERDTGTVLEGVSVEIMKHISGVYTDCPAIMSVNVTATYNPEDGRSPTKWASS